MALEELSTGKYDGVNYVIADAESGWVVHGSEEAEVVQLEDGLSIVSNGDVNDPRRTGEDGAAIADAPDARLAGEVPGGGQQGLRPHPSPPGRPSMVVRSKSRGTVSSTLISLGQKGRGMRFSSMRAARRIRRSTRIIRRCCAIFSVADYGSTCQGECLSRVASRSRPNLYNRVLPCFPTSNAPPVSRMQ